MTNEQYLLIIASHKSVSARMHPKTNETRNKYRIKLSLTIPYCLVVRIPVSHPGGPGQFPVSPKIRGIEHWEWVG